MTETQQLLADYAGTGSEAAFKELVARYINLVYATALRLVGGDTHLAEDVTQTVFMDLSRNAQRLSRESLLGGWLHRDTCFVAGKIMRRERRRQAREQQAALMNSLEDHSGENLEKVAPILDEAINLLADDDRTAILLRFFEQRDFRAVGAALGSNEDAARMRVNRAVEKLQAMFKHRGVALSAAALATALTAHAASAAPLGLAASVAGSVLAGSVAAGGITTTVFKTMISTKLKIGIVGAVVIAGAATSLVVQHQARARVQAQNDAVEAQAADLNKLAADNERLSNRIAGAKSQAPSDRDELVRLRGDVAALRGQTNSLTALLAENRRLKDALQAARQKQYEVSEMEPVNTRLEADSKMSCAMDLGMSLFEYAGDHKQMFPTNFAQSLKYLRPETAKQTNFTSAEFEMAYTGSRDALDKYAHPEEILLLKEKAPWKTSDGKLAKVYIYANGMGMTLSAKDGNFEAWEKQHTVPPEPAP